MQIFERQVLFVLPFDNLAPAIDLTLSTLSQLVGE